MKCEIFTDNIINNAVIHSGTTKIDIKINSIDDKCILKIIDYGIGIPDKIKQDVFKEEYIFGKSGKAGIGLFIANEFVKQCGREISIENNKPKGTAFILRIPNAR